VPARGERAGLGLAVAHYGQGDQTAALIPERATLRG
jgi:hypothetical protein